jgi:hypothetical protein
MVERVVASIEGNRSEFKGSLPQPKEISALWLSLDGDDTSNHFQVTIEELTLNGPENK